MGKLEGRPALSVSRQGLGQDAGMSSEHSVGRWSGKPLPHSCSGPRTPLGAMPKWESSRRGSTELWGGEVLHLRSVRAESVQSSPRLWDGSPSGHRGPAEQNVGQDLQTQVRGSRRPLRPPHPAASWEVGLLRGAPRQVGEFAKTSREALNPPQLPPWVTQS